MPLPALPLEPPSPATSNLFGASSPAGWIDKRTGITYRQARTKDIPAIVAFAHKGLETNPLPGMRVDRAKVYKAAKYVVETPRQFAMVASHDGKIVGSLCAVVDDCDWYERKQASVLQYWSEYPGAGIGLLRAFRDWAKLQPAIKALVVMVEHGSDPRIPRVLERVGFRVTSPAYWMGV